MLKYTKEIEARYRRGTDIAGGIVTWGSIALLAIGFCFWLYGMYLWIFT